MTFPSIRFRRPSASELAVYAERLRRAGCRLEIAARMAQLAWEADVKQANPNAFPVPYFKWIPDFNYDASLVSREWKAIRRRKMEASGYRCECCGSKATQVHHRDYRPRVLTGEDLLALVALCAECHRFIEWDESGQKREWQGKERALVERSAAGRGATDAACGCGRNSGDPA
jgi:hypothetical protein